MPDCQMMNNLSFVPCSSSATIGIIGGYDNMKTFVPQMSPNSNRLNYQYKEFKLSWWEDNSFFFYPYILISAYYGIKYKNIRQQYNIPENVIIIGDSGGFQNMTQDETINPLEVLQWQEQNCNIGFIFDNPISPDDSKEIKLNKQKITVENGLLALRNKTNKNLKLYGVIQGHTFDEQKNIIDEYKKTESFEQYDGFSIGGIVPIASNIDVLIKVLTCFFDNFKNDKRPLHILGLSGIKSIGLINYLKKIYKKENVTFDSSSYGSGAIRLEFINLFNGFKTTFGDNSLNQLNKLPCICPVCSNILDPSIIRKGGSMPGALLSLHNLYQYIQYTYFISVLSSDLSLFENYLIKKNGFEQKTFDFIKYSYENGFEAAIEKEQKTQDIKKWF